MDAAFGVGVKPLLALRLVVGLDLFQKLVGFGVAVGWGFPDDGEEDHADDAEGDGYLEDRVPTELVGEGSEDETGDRGAGVAEDAGHSVGGGGDTLRGLVGQAYSYKGLRHIDEEAGHYDQGH